MSLTRDIPSELNTFAKLFEQWAYRWDYATVFDDFLTMCLPNFSFEEEYANARDEIKKKYNEKEIDLFRECFKEMFRVYNEQIQILGWYDFFGEMYQAITGNYKSKRMGQYFTPPHLCTMIADMSIGDSMEHGQTVNDPACGSSRMLLAAHVKTIYKGKRLYLVGQDVDPMCCKMSVLNFIVHGCEGEILCMNSISMDYRFGYRVKIYPLIPIPVISSLAFEHSSLLVRKEKETVVESIPSKQPAVVIDESIKEEVKEKVCEQGELFV